MGLVLGFVELLGGILLLASAIANASFADVIRGKAGQDYTTDQASSGTLASTLAAAGTSAPSASTVNTATGAVSGTGRAGLTSGQATFAQQLAARTGLNINVIAAWLLAEESGSAAQSRQAAGNNDWLNIGYTGTATYDATDSIWSNPTSAAAATAQWLQGHDVIPGYGTASGGIQAILRTAGQSATAQIHAIQTSGWTSSGYPDLATLYQEVTS